MMMGFWFVDLLRDNPAMLVSWVLWVIFSICLHELGHGLVAIWQGDDTPIRRGRITLNPLVHMGPMSLIAFVFVGLAWGQMPVNPRQFRWGRFGDVLVSFAGPAVNLLLALVSLTGYAVMANHVTGSSSSGTSPGFIDNLEMFFYTGGMLNILLAIFNLLPVPPLDGAHILGGLSKTADRLYRSEQFEQGGIIIFLLVLYFFSNDVSDVAAIVTRYVSGVLMQVV